MDLEKALKLLGHWQGLIAAGASLLTAALAFRTELLKWEPWAWSWPELAFVSAAIGLVVFFSVRSRRAGASRLANPDALKLDPQSPDQLFGRQGDLDKLLNALANPLIFLVSESGCGKSALLRAGVAQGTPFVERFLPIYIDMSALDWEDTPLRAVRENFFQNLKADDPDRGSLDKDSEPVAYADVFDRYYKRIHRRPLLLLDQFDDYQAEAQHRDRFLPQDTRIWRTADEIARDNAFWRVLQACLEKDAVSIIAASREDAAKGLESLRFHPRVPQFDLPRLEPGLVGTIIDRLTDRAPDDSPVVTNPKRGWTALRDRLVDDLEAHGQLLPQQLKVTLGGLRTLRRLTPAAYSRAGRAAGLEAASVAGSLQRAAYAAKLTEDQVLQIVLQLVDRTREPPDKSLPRSSAEIARRTGLPEAEVERALIRLEADEIVRQRGASESATAGWQLHHAYLVQPILLIESDRNRWRQLLVERAHAYKEASLPRKWKTLLPIAAQARLAIARIRGRFRYGEHRAYALKSLARALPGLAAVALVGAVWWAADEYVAAGQIERQLAVVGDEGRLSDDAAAGLSYLPERGWIARWWVARNIFRSPVQAGRFAEVPGPVLRAIVRLDPSRLDGLVRRYVSPNALQQPDSRLRAAVGQLVHASSMAAMDQGTIPAVYDTLATSLRASLTNTDIDLQVVAGGILMASSAPSGDGSSVEGLLAAIRDAVIDGRVGDAVGPDLTKAYAAFVATIPDGDALADEMLVRIKETANDEGTPPSQLPSLVESYRVLAARFDSTEGKHADGMLTALGNAITKKNTSLGELHMLVESYQTLSDDFQDADMDGAESILATLHDATLDDKVDLAQRVGLARDYAALRGTAAADGGHPDSYSDDVLSVLGSAVGEEGLDLSRLSVFAETYATVAANLDHALPQREEVLTALHHAIVDESTNEFRLTVLASAYAKVEATTSVGAYPPEETAARSKDVLASLRRALVDNKTNPYQLEELAEAFGSVAVNQKTAAQHVQDTLAALREAIVDYRTDSPQEVTNAYVKLSGMFKGGEIDLTGEMIAMHKTLLDSKSNASLLPGLARAFAAASVNAKAGSAYTQQVLEILHDVIVDEEDVYQRQRLAVAYSTVASTGEESQKQTEDVLAALREVLGAQSFPTDMVETYVELASHLMDSDHSKQELSGLSDILASGATSQLDLWRAAAAYAAVAQSSQPDASHIRDVANLLRKVPSLRDPMHCTHVANALREAVRLSLPHLSWEQIGLVYADVMLEPVCAGDATVQLVNDVEAFLRKSTAAPQIREGWSGDVWAFAVWAQGNIPGFSPHEPKVTFLAGTEPSPGASANESAHLIAPGSL